MSILHLCQVSRAHLTGTLYSYGTEPAVGKALKQSGISRDEVWITTKLWNSAFPLITHMHRPSVRTN